MHGHLETCKLLLQHGADPQADHHNAIRWASNNRLLRHTKRPREVTEEPEMPELAIRLVKKEQSHRANQKIKTKNPLEI